MINLFFWQELQYAFKNPLCYFSYVLRIVDCRQAEDPFQQIYILFSHYNRKKIKYVLFFLRASHFTTLILNSKQDYLLKLTCRIIIFCTKKDNIYITCKYIYSMYWQVQTANVCEFLSNINDKEVTLVISKTIKHQKNKQAVHISFPFLFIFLIGYFTRDHRDLKL